MRGPHVSHDGRPQEGRNPLHRRERPLPRFPRAAAHLHHEHGQVGRLTEDGPVPRPTLEDRPDDERLHGPDRPRPGFGARVAPARSVAQRAENDGGGAQSDGNGRQSNGAVGCRKMVPDASHRARCGSRRTAPKTPRREDDRDEDKKRKKLRENRSFSQQTASVCIRLSSGEAGKRPEPEHQPLSGTAVIANPFQSLDLVDFIQFHSKTLGIMLDNRNSYVSFTTFSQVPGKLEQAAGGVSLRRISRLREFALCRRARNISRISRISR